MGDSIYINDDVVSYVDGGVDVVDNVISATDKNEDAK